MELMEFIALAEEILEVDSGTLDLENSLDDIDWDSLANISFIAEIDARVNRSIDAERLSHAETLADVFALVPELISDAP